MRKDCQKKKYKCDFCEYEACTECYRITASEVKVLQLVGPRKLKLQCENCQNKDSCSLLKKIIEAEDQNLEANKNLLETKNDLLLAREEEIAQLKEKLEKSTTPSYAEIAQKRSDIYQPKEKTPMLIIKPKTVQEVDNTKEDMYKLLERNGMKIGINKLRSAKDGAIRVRCRSKDETELLAMKINSEPEDKYGVEVEKLQKPKLKIVKIERKFGYEELKTKIIEQNFENDQSIDLQVQYIQYIQNRNTYTAFIEVSAETYLKIMTRRKLYIGLQRYNVYNDLNMKRCWKCAAYGHSGKNCGSEKFFCQECAGEHETVKCPNKNIHKCINCLEANEKYKTNRAVNHSAQEVENCDTYKDRKKFLISKTDHPLGRFLE